jgi:hypothetical protein
LNFLGKLQKPLLPHRDLFAGIIASYWFATDPLGANEAAKLREHLAARHVSIEYKAGDGNHQQPQRRK